MATLAAVGAVVLSLVMALAPGALVAAEPVTVFAAASLNDALRAVGAAWQGRSGQAVRYSFASSSTLARQIAAGAPADIFASANESWMDDLAGKDLIIAASRISPIGNGLVLVAPAASPLSPVAVDASLDLASLLAGGRLAVGDPAHVPAGIYARLALENLGLWPAVQDRLAQANDVRAALALVERGEAPLGIVYATDAALSDRVRVLGAFPPGSHPPATYPFAIIEGRETPAVSTFFAFATGPDAHAIYQRFGFSTGNASR